MRKGTKRAYEARIKMLEDLLDTADDQSSYWYSSMKEADRRPEKFRGRTRQGESQRQWAIEQAISANQPNIVHAATQIANYVYGEDTANPTA